MHVPVDQTRYYDGKDLPVVHVDNQVCRDSKSSAVLIDNSLICIILNSSQLVDRLNSYQSTSLTRARSACQKKPTSKVGSAI